MKEQQSEVTVKLTVIGMPEVCNWWLWSGVEEQFGDVQRERFVRGQGADCAPAYF